jgi:hypothetical protein
MANRQMRQRSCQLSVGWPVARTGFAGHLATTWEATTLQLVPAGQCLVHRFQPPAVGNVTIQVSAVGLMPVC